MSLNEFRKDLANVSERIMIVLCSWEDKKIPDSEAIKLVNEIWGEWLKFEATKYGIVEDDI